MGPRGAGPTGVEYRAYSKTRPWLQIGQLGCRVWPVRAEWGWGGVGHALGGVGHARTGQVGPRGAGSVRFEWGRVGPSRAGWGCRGVGHALGFTLAEEEVGRGARSGSGSSGAC